MEATKTKWPIKLYNIVAGSKVQIDPKQLIKNARSKSGLTNLGEDFNVEPLEVLCKSINDEARLHAFGGFMMKQKLIGQLEGRLWAEHWIRKHPEILEQPLLPVVLITGLQRTGTTKLQRLLSELPDARGLKSWEGLYPAPIGSTSETSKRINKTKLNERAVRWIAPSFYSIHPIEHDNYEEDVLLLDLHFMSSASEAIMQVPSYADYLNHTDQTSAYAYEMKLLKLLQWQRSSSYWVLKSPHHLEYLDIIHQLIPELKLIWTHRDPKATIPSYMSMLYHGRRMFSDEVSPTTITDHWIPKIDRMLTKGLQDIKTLPAVRHIDFNDLVQQESAIIEELADWIGSTGRPSANVVRPYHSQHTYDLQDWNLTSDSIDRRFDYYLKAMKSLGL